MPVTSADSPTMRRRLGGSDLVVSPVSMGCWPITGMTSLEVTHAQSLATLEAAYDAGVNFFDTAYCYGADGESERLIAAALGNRREDLVIATKGGIHWDDQLQRVIDGRPATLVRQCDTSLSRLNFDYVEIFYLHAPDPTTPIEDSAGAIAELIAAGKARYAGASNCSLEQLMRFHEVCPLAVIQPPYNMLMRDIEADILPWCLEHDVGVACYWPLMKGLLAGKLSRGHQFDPRDGRAKYPMFQGEQWERNQDLIDELSDIAASLKKPLSELVINWTIGQRGLTSAICGAKRPEQIRETAEAMQWQLSDEDAQRIAQALHRRGKAESRWAV